jgi:hypothetical protein
MQRCLRCGVACERDISIFLFHHISILFDVCVEIIVHFFLFV